MNGVQLLFFGTLLCVVSGCANIVPPTGGLKDEKPPVLLSVSPRDSQTNARVKRIDLKFDEYIELSNPATEVTITPMLRVPLMVDAALRTVTIRIPDSLLTANTTYRISLNKAVRDLNEGNIFEGYNYLFSTGPWFDSLSLVGVVTNAFTGAPDTGCVVVLIDATLPDSSIIRLRPPYAARVNSAGQFSFQGLPERQFRLYAIQDINANYIYDGGKEGIAFLDTPVTPTTAPLPTLKLSLFQEPITDTLPTTGSAEGQEDGLRTQKKKQKSNGANGLDPDGFSFVADIDTSDQRRRTMGLDKVVQIFFSRRVQSVFANRVTLTYDSSGTAVVAPFTLAKADTVRHIVTLQTAWRADKVYTLRLLKGFAKDSTSADALPVKYVFRTRREEDYATLKIRTAGKWVDSQHILVVMHGSDTLYQQVMRDSVFQFRRLEPGAYSMYVIEDINGDTYWTTGDLFQKRQPEPIIRYPESLNLRAGWDHIVDFLPVDDVRRNKRP